MLSRFASAARRALRPCPPDCGALYPAHAYRDVSFADGQISPDQAGIAAVLPGLLAPGARLLHVGVGCSDLAVRFAGRVARIDGITVCDDERARAEALGLPGYRVTVLNKHAPALAALPGPYDLVVDNNPGSFACCVRHVRFTLSTYAALLAPRGRVVTHERGARYRQPGGLSLPWRRWAREGRAVGLVPERLTDAVWALRRAG